MQKFIFATLLSLNLAAQAAESTGSIAGAADADAQIIVTNLATGQVIGIMAKCDGTYRAEGLKPGRYQIKENGPHHAARQVGVEAGKQSEVDLAPAKSSTCKTN